MVITNFYFSSEATQKWLGITVKILKVLAYMLTFLVVLGTAAITLHVRFKFELRHCYSAMLAFLLLSITLGHRLACQPWP